MNTQATNHQLGLWALVKRSRPINLITGPMIYSVIVPLLLLDAFVSLYQLLCFPIYKVKSFRRSEFIVFDRQELKYLDWISKFHCTYCAYAVGLMAFVSAVIGATEAYFCPIKHRSKQSHGPVRSYPFLAYEQSDDFDFDLRLNGMREAMMKQRNL
jgi:hypothetical protein